MNSLQKYENEKNDDGPANKPTTDALLSAKSKLRKGSSSHSVDIAPGISRAESPPPAARLRADPHTPSPPHNKQVGDIMYTATPKEGSPGSSPGPARLGSRSSSSSSTSPRQLYQPKPSAQPVKSAMKKSTRTSSSSSTDDPRFGPKLDPREELMKAIRTAGGRTMLNKVI